jgi:formate/nitrite transporter
VTFDLSPALGIGLKKLIAGAAFSIGLMLVVIAGAELYTGNSLMVSSVMIGEVTWQKVLAKWCLVYAANFVGSILLALLFYFSGLWKTGNGLLGETAVRVAHAKVHLGFWEAFVRAVGCNWLVCLAVWMALASRQVVGKIFAIFFPIMGFVAIGFEHCVANMYFIPTGIFLNHWAGIAPAGLDMNSLTWTAFVVNNLIPVTIEYHRRRGICGIRVLGGLPEAQPEPGRITCRVKAKKARTNRGDDPMPAMNPPDGIMAPLTT